MSSPTPTPTRERSGVSRLMGPVNTLVERFIPSALVFAIVLTVITMIGALLLTDAGPLDVVRAWGDGLAGLLAFMTQMALILLLGYILANTGPVRALLLKLNSDDHPHTSSRLGIRSIPTLLLFERGVERRRISGTLPARDLVRWVIGT